MAILVVGQNAIATCARLAGLNAKLTNQAAPTHIL